MSNQPKNQGALASIILIATLAIVTFSYVSFEANQFKLVSKGNADTSIYEHVAISTPDDVSPDVTLEMRRGIEGLYYLRDDDASATTDMNDDATRNIDDFEAAFEEAFRESELDNDESRTEVHHVNSTNDIDIWSPSLVSPEHIQHILSTDTSKSAELLPSPACHPHFNLALQNGQFNNITKFKRIYLYHARKAGGSSMSQYFSHVAKTYGLDYMAREWGRMEEPGFGEKDTFYVAHVREPVSLRCILNFESPCKTHSHLISGSCVIRLIVP